MNCKYENIILIVTLFLHPSSVLHFILSRRCTRNTISVQTNKYDGLVMIETNHNDNCRWPLLFVATHQSRHLFGLTVLFILSGLWVILSMPLATQSVLMIWLLTLVLQNKTRLTTMDRDGGTMLVIEIWYARMCSPIALALAHKGTNFEQ